jgi:hypothetical protein
MTTGSVKCLRNMWGDGVGLFACQREAVRRGKKGNLPSKTSRFWRLRTRKKFDSVPDLGILRKIVDYVRRRSFIWEIPDKGRAL